MKSKKIIFIVFVIILDLFVNFIFVYGQIQRMEGSSQLINDIGRIRGGIQRTIKLEIAGNSSVDAELYVDEKIQNLIAAIDVGKVAATDTILENILDIANQWSDLKQEMITFRTTPNEEQLLNLVLDSEELWTIADQAVTEAQSNQEKNLGTERYLLILILFNLALGVTLLFYIKKYVENELEKYVNFDYLTKTYNRRFLMEYLIIEIKKAERKKNNLAVALIDIDNFKLVNDTFGHTEGDHVLQDVAKIMKSNVRRSDIVSRYGGEEFLIVMNDTTEQGAMVLAEKIRKAVEIHQFTTGNITISLGVSCFSSGTSIDLLIKHADDAMYQAKKEGKNRAVLY